MNVPSIRLRIFLATALLVALCGCHHDAKPPAKQQASRPQHVQPPPQQLSYPMLVARGTEELRIKMEMQENTFQISRAAWNVDQGSGTIRFESPSGLVATAPVQIIGTYNTADGTWLWGWDNPSVQPALAEHASAFREYWEQNSLPELTTAKLTCDQEHCWTFVAAIAAMTNAQGAYRGMDGNTAVFMTFGAMEVSKPR